jgi:hypothetical protein
MSQHYGMHAPSTLAKSILANRHRLAELLPPERRAEVDGLHEATVGAWIQHNTARVHLFLPTPTGALTLSLLEVFVQCRLKPVFEGKVPDNAPSNPSLQPTGAARGSEV